MFRYQPNKGNHRNKTEGIKDSTISKSNRVVLLLRRLLWLLLLWTTFLYPFFFFCRDASLYFVLTVFLPFFLACSFLSLFLCIYLLYCGFYFYWVFLINLLFSLEVSWYVRLYSFVVLSTLFSLFASLFNGRLSHIKKLFGINAKKGEMKSLTLLFVYSSASLYKYQF